MKGAKHIQKLIKGLKRKGEIPLIPYLTCWDPDLETTEAILWELAEIEPACIELGFPFSDPVADGPTIQKAVVRALKHRPSFEEFFEFVGKLNHKGYPIPLVCMTYYNIIYRFGLENTVEEALKTGLSGFIIADLPIDEAGPWLEVNKGKGLATIFLATPTSSEERIKKIAKVCSGFIYYVSLTGVTGARDKLPEDVINRLELVKKLSSVPVGVGFGVSKKEHVKMLAPYADAIIIGSAIVKIVEKKGKKAPKEIKKFLQSLIK
ncbi:MAG: tryptophan synthase subunit alpha [Thermodesulfobacterium sp.]|nr:tryptophan synthase subunit alpha [Thermodesulfobacterium sp.]MCD6548287.1 tryptophan synthase subunit alpha [Thermodesulfobacterium sp.]